MSSKQSSADSVDISDNLRELMKVHKLTVADMAGRVGVSKSAMEKYLAGPSSPRAATIRAICLEFDVDAEWLLFGYKLRLSPILMSASYSTFQALINELKQPNPISEKFSEIEWASSNWRQFVSDVASERAEELNQDVSKRVFEDHKLQRDGARLEYGPDLVITTTEESEDGSTTTKTQGVELKSTNR